MCRCHWSTLPIERFQILCEFIIKLLWHLGHRNTNREGDSMLLKEQVCETESGHEHLCLSLGVDVHLVSGMSSCSASCVLHARHIFKRPRSTDAFSVCERWTPHRIWGVFVRSCGEGFEVDCLWVVCCSMDVFVFT